MDDFKHYAHTVEVNEDTQTYVHELVVGVAEHYRPLSVSSAEEIDHEFIDKHIAKEEHRAWNDELQRTHEMPSARRNDINKRNKAIAKLTQDFLQHVEVIAKYIVQQRGTHEKWKSKKLNLDKSGLGQCGGIKYRGGNVFFKFALDDRGIFKGCNAYAIKQAKNEIRAANAINAVGVTLLHTTLSAALRIRGHVVIAFAWAPIAHSTLVYGSDDAGRTIHDESPRAKELMKLACEHFHIQPQLIAPKEDHRVVDMESKHDAPEYSLSMEHKEEDLTDEHGYGVIENLAAATPAPESTSKALPAYHTIDVQQDATNDPTDVLGPPEAYQAILEPIKDSQATDNSLEKVLLYSAVDVEVHASKTDGRYYVIDPARWFPPVVHSVEPGHPCGVFYILYRPEFMRRHAPKLKHKLAPDTYSNFGENTPAHHAAHRAAQSHLIDVTVKLARRLVKSVARLHSKTAKAAKVKKARDLLQQPLSQVLHREGINMRFLGSVWSTCKKYMDGKQTVNVSPETQQALRVLVTRLEVEMFVRCVKSFFNLLQRQIDADSDLPFEGVAVIVLQFICRPDLQSVEAVQDFWNVVLPRLMRIKFHVDDVDGDYLKTHIQPLFTATSLPPAWQTFFPFPFPAADYETNSQGEHPLLAGLLHAMQTTLEKVDHHAQPHSTTAMAATHDNLGDLFSCLASQKAMARLLGKDSLKAQTTCTDNACCGIRVRLHTKVSIVQASQVSVKSRGLVESEQVLKEELECRTSALYQQTGPSMPVRSSSDASVTSSTSSVNWPVRSLERKLRRSGSIDTLNGDQTVVSVDVAGATNKKNSFQLLSTLRPLLRLYILWDEKERENKGKEVIPNMVAIASQASTPVVEKVATYDMIAAFYSSCNRFEDEVKYYQDALQAQQTFGKDDAGVDNDSELARRHYYLARACRNVSRQKHIGADVKNQYVGRSLQHFKETLRLLHDKAGHDDSCQCQDRESQLLLADTLNSLAYLYKQQPELGYDGFLALFEEALQIREKHLRATDPVVAGSFYSLALVKAKLKPVTQERLLEAFKLFEKSFEIRERELHLDDVDTAYSQLKLVKTHFKLEHPQLSPEQLLKHIANCFNVFAKRFKAGHDHLEDARELLSKCQELCSTSAAAS